MAKEPSITKTSPAQEKASGFISYSDEHEAYAAARVSQFVYQVCSPLMISLPYFTLAFANSLLKKSPKI